MELEKELKQLFSNIEDTGLDVSDVIDIFNKYKPTQFKVATEDSPEVLEKPTMKTHHPVQMEMAKIEYDKAPSISEDRLKLNIARVLIDDLEKQVYTWKGDWDKEFKENDRLSKQLTEANKQHKEVVDVFKSLELYKNATTKDDTVTYTDVHYDSDLQLLSKLNKD